MLIKRRISLTLTSSCTIVGGSLLDRIVEEAHVGDGSQRCSRCGGRVGSRCRETRCGVRRSPWPVRAGGGPLVYPRRLIPSYDEFLRSIDLAQVTEDGFWQLCSQLLALVAQVMIVERQARWVPDRASTTESVYYLEVPTAGNSVWLDSAALVKQVLDSEAPQATMLVSLAEYQLDSASYRGSEPETGITRTFGSERGVY
jgi:hypothetical protein